MRGYPTQDGARAAEVTFDGTRPPRCIAGRRPTRRWNMRSTSASPRRAPKPSALMDTLVAITVEYMNTRKQFGVTIASFQALRHRIADVKMQLELARSMSYYASLKLGESRRRGAVRCRRPRCSSATSMRFVGQQCIQLHGGIGVTDEYIASHYFKRLTMLEMSFGDTLHHLGEVSMRMQDTAGVFA